MPPKQGSHQWRRITIPIPPELSDRIDAAVHGLPGETLTSLIRRAVAGEIDRLEMERGGGGMASPFPPAPGRPPPGRPRKGVGDEDTPASRAAPAATDSSAEVERLLHVLETSEAEEPKSKAARTGGGA